MRSGYHTSMVTKPAAAKPELIVLIPFLKPWHDELGAEFAIHFPAAAEHLAYARAHGAAIRGVITNGTTGTSAELIAALPKLEIIAAFSSGYEGVDLVAARTRGIAVTNAIGANAASVADFAIGMMLAIVRDLRNRDLATRAGRWNDIRGLTPTLTGKRLGLIGLGSVGRTIAKRAAAFEMPIAYTQPRRIADAPYPWYPTPRELAAASDYLVVACPGGAATRHLVTAAVLDALGPTGTLINIARGSVVDTAALIDALRGKRIAAAGLDVYEDEPAIPRELFGLDNVLLAPHIAGFTQEAFRNAFELVRDNLRAHFAGAPLVTPVRV